MFIHPGEALIAGRLSLAACCACRFLRHFVPQKPQFTGSCEPLVRRGLQGKKSPDRRFFGVLRVKRNKLLAGERGDPPIPERPAL
jgi:hypothetical protein